MSICGNMVGGLITPKSFVLVDENNVELVGVTVGEETVLTANAKTDIRKGVVAATEEGVVTGEATIPNYETVTGQKVIMPNSAFTIELPNSYDYTEIQCIICQFNTSFDDSVASTRVVIGNNVYDSNSTVVVATLTKNADKKSIDFNLTNTSDTMYILRYFTYRELY